MKARNLFAAVVLLASPVIARQAHIEITSSQFNCFAAPGQVVAIDVPASLTVEERQAFLKSALGDPELNLRSIPAFAVNETARRYELDRLGELQLRATTPTGCGAGVVTLDGLVPGGQAFPALTMICTPEWSMAGWVLGTESGSFILTIAVK